MRYLFVLLGLLFSFSAQVKFEVNVSVRVEAHLKYEEQMLIIVNGKLNFVSDARGVTFSQFLLEGAPERPELRTQSGSAEEAEAYYSTTFS